MKHTGLKVWATALAIIAVCYALMYLACVLAQVTS